MPYIVDRNKVVTVNQNNKYDSKPLPYSMNDLNSVFTHYDKDKGYNVPTENKLNGGVDNNGKSSK
jgi:hypothetical protein